MINWVFRTKKRLFQWSKEECTKVFVSVMAADTKANTIKSQKFNNWPLMCSYGLPGSFNSNAIGVCNHLIISCICFVDSQIHKY